MDSDPPMDRVTAARTLGVNPASPTKPRVCADSFRKSRRLVTMGWVAASERKSTLSEEPVSSTRRKVISALRFQGECGRGVARVS